MPNGPFRHPQSIFWAFKGLPCLPKIFSDSAPLPASRLKLLSVSELIQLRKDLRFAQSYFFSDIPKPSSDFPSAFHISHFQVSQSPARTMKRFVLLACTCKLPKLLLPDPEHFAWSRGHSRHGILLLAGAVNSTADSLRIRIW